jgi:hypothetical protein
LVIGSYQRGFVEEWVKGGLEVGEMTLFEEEW